MALAVREVAGEQVLDLGELVLVASKSEANVWHEVQGGRCDCKGYQYRGRCRHLTALAALPEPSPSPVGVEWSEQFGGWLVTWGNFLHGGVHFNRADADAHAADLAADPTYDEWLALHGYGKEVDG